MTDQIYLGIDRGDKRTGLAVSDATALIASGLKTVEAQTDQKLADLIVVEIAEIRPVGIIVGYPVAPDGGSAGERCQAIDRFVTVLKKRIKKQLKGRLEGKVDLPIYLQDERGSTKSAIETIHAHGKKISKKRRESGAVDLIAATIILQRWLDRHQAGRG